MPSLTAYICNNVHAISSRYIFFAVLRCVLFRLKNPIKCINFRFSLSFDWYLNSFLCYSKCLQMLHAVPAISRTFLSWQLKFGPIVGSSVLMFLLRNYIYPRRVTFLGHGILYHKCSFFVFSIHAEEDLCRRFDMFRLIRQNLK